MSQYQLHVLDTVPLHYWPLTRGFTDSNFSTTQNDVVNSATMSHFSSISSVDQTRARIVGEAVDEYSFGLGSSHYFTINPTQFSETTYQTFSISLMFRRSQFSTTAPHILFSGADYTIYIASGRICFNASTATTTTSATALMAADEDLIPDESYHVTMICDNDSGNQNHVKVFLNGKKVLDSLELGVSVSSFMRSSISYLGRSAASSSSSTFFGAGTADAPAVQHFVLWDRALSDFEASRLGYFGIFTADAVTVSGSIIEGYVADEYRVRIHRLLDGALMHEEDTTTASFSVLLPDLEYYVIVSASQGDVWLPSTSAGIDDLVYPTNPSATRFYFKCISAGITGTSEPVWQSDQSVPTPDGSAVWEVVEGLIQPVANAPVRGI